MSVRGAMNVLHGFLRKNFLNTGDHMCGVRRGAGEDGETLFCSIQQDLNIRDHARNVGRDDRVLEGMLAGGRW